MGKNEFTNEWLTEYMARLRDEVAALEAAHPLLALEGTDVPDPGLEYSMVPRNPECKEIYQRFARASIGAAVCGEALKDPEIPDPGPETVLQQKVLDYCKEAGWPCFHDRSRKVNEPGWPDNIIFLPQGVVVLIELKSSAGKFRKEQYELRRKLGWLDHVVYVARSMKHFRDIICANLKKG